MATSLSCCNAQADSPVPPCGEAAAEIAMLRSQGEWYGALAEIERQRGCRPDDPGLRRLRILTLADIGSNDTAWRLAQRSPGLLDGAEMDRLTSKRLARLISWSEVGRDEAARLQSARQALRASDAYRAQAGSDDASAMLRARLDRLLLLNRLGRHQEVADEQAMLAREGIQLPVYVVGAVSDSLMALHRPGEAASLLDPHLDASAANAPFQVRHAFATLEMERGHAAIDDLGRYAAGQPALRWDRQHRARQRNWARYDADLARIQITAYAGDAAAAQAELEAMLAIAPASGTLQGALGQTYLMRGWPRRALDRFRIAAMLQPDDLQARIGEVEALVALHRDDQAAPRVARLVQEYPGSARVDRLERDWRRHRGWQGGITAGGGASAGGGMADAPLGSRDAEYAMTLRSPLLAERWRVRAGALGRRADPHGETVNRRDAYLGLGYAHGPLDASLDWRAVGIAPGGDGADLRLGWQAGDRWSFAAGYHRNAADASLQAQQAGVTADQVEITARYQPDDLHSLRASAGRLLHSDGNRRQSLALRYEQQLTHADRWWLDGSAGGYASRASLDDAPYFNPSRDFSLDLGLRISQRPWRQYDRHFLHRLEIGAGSYWQQGYGTAWVPTARYEHEWRLAPGRTLRYGLSWARPVYDGTRERRLALDAGFYWEE